MGFESLLPDYGSVAQLAERLSEEQEAGRSIRPGATWVSSNG